MEWLMVRIARRSIAKYLIFCSFFGMATAARGSWYVFVPGSKVDLFGNAGATDFDRASGDLALTSGENTNFVPGYLGNYGATSTPTRATVTFTASDGAISGTGSGQITVGGHLTDQLLVQWRVEASLSSETAPNY